MSLSRYRIEPASDQLQILPEFAARWWLPAAMATATEFERVLLAEEFRPKVVTALQARLRRDPETGEAMIPADETLLEMFDGEEHARWCGLVGRYPVNRTYRWPLSFRADELDALEAQERWREAVRRIRRWAVRAGDQFVFADVFLLQDAFASLRDRRAFWRAALGADVWFLKLQQSGSDREDIAAQSAYWQVNGRYRAIEPFLNAVAAVTERPRIDVVHLLPRLPRALLNTFPPDLESAPDAGVESSVVASQFFETEAGMDPEADGTFVDWLEKECVPVDGAGQYGDVVVYGDLERSPWPYAGIYVAADMLFARRPTLLGPWQFIHRDEVAALNPRLGGRPPKVFRRREARADAAPPFMADSLPEAWREPVSLRAVPAGPWGKLWCYDVLLAPPGDTLEKLDPPAREPVWAFDGITVVEIQEHLAAVEMPDDVRRELQELFAQARWEPPGLLVAHPPTELVLQTPREFRARVFPFLMGGGSVADYAQHIPFPPGVTPEKWFDVTAVSEAQRAQLAELFYPCHGEWRLSDFGALYHALPTESQQLSAQRAALRMPALVVLLERPAPGEAAAIAEYWSGGKDKSMRVLLQSFAASEDRFLDITHLLPPIARELVNTYFLPPTPAMTPSCFWTTFNFGAEEPDERYLVIPGVWTEHREVAWQDLLTNYERVTAPAQWGDVIAYRTGNVEAVDHVCVFLADGVVFTKNGYAFSAPWILSSLASVDEVYRKDPATERVTFRKRMPR